MLDKLYRSHSLEFSDNNTSGSLTIWEDSPVSPFDVGDIFYPVDNGPALTVDKVSIKDNVIGECLGKIVRQWEITIEGSNNSSSSAQEQNTHVKYNFNISENEKSGTMEVINTGNVPAISLDIGDSFSVPGIGSVICVKVSGNDSYDDDNVHSWTVTYEGSDNPTVASDNLPETKYSLSIEKDNDGDIQKSGSMSVVNEGNAPVFDVSVGSQFSIPGIGNITCTKVSANDDYSDSGVHRWNVTYEGIIAGDSGGSDNDDESQGTNAKYTFSIDNDAMSGSVEITATGNAPVFAHEVGDTINLPGIGNVICTKISGSDSYSDSGKRKWTVVYEASTQHSQQEQQNASVKYSLSIENNSDGITVYSGSKEFLCSGNAPTPNIEIGDTFILPLIGQVTCTKIHSTNDESGSWMVTVEGSRAGAVSDDDEPVLPDSETTITYEINGSTVRSVSGEFIALRRSQTPITKKSITVYSDSATALTIPGDIYEGGIVLSENISFETIKNEGVITASYYKHSIEVEA